MGTDWVGARNAYASKKLRTYKLLYFSCPPATVELDELVINMLSTGIYTVLTDIQYQS